MARTQIVRDVYHAFVSGDRRLIERVFADEFTFSSPLDAGLDRAGWPTSSRLSTVGNRR